MATPIYYLFVYSIPNTVLKRISQIAGKFSWANGDNPRGILLANWSTITSNKAEGGMGVRNISLIKHSLMAKNLFNYFNKQDSIWVDILYMKYGDFNFWTHNVLSSCSAFFKGLSHTASIIMSHLWINCVNPFTTSIIFHPWIFDVLIAFKPMPLNMNVDFEHC